MAPVRTAHLPAAGRAAPRCTTYRYDWQRYFYGHGGMSLRWTHARARLWRHRFRSIGVLRPKLIEVKHEDSSGLGDDE
eukprot:scaffold95998_cov27-Tisochrysis_lutea.AAC.3